MKKHNFLFSILIILFLNSCKSDGGKDDVEVEGTWNLTEFKTSIPTDYNQDGNETTDFMAETNNCYADNKLVFSSDNTGVSSGSYADIYVELEVGTTDNLIIQVDCLDDDDDYVANWSQTDNTVTFDEVQGTLSGDELTFFVEGATYTDIENNIEIEIITDFTLVYTKQ